MSNGNYGNYGCILQNIENNEIIKKQDTHKVYKKLKHIDANLHNEIKILNRLTYNNSINTNENINNNYLKYLFSFSSFNNVKLSVSNREEILKHDNIPLEQQHKEVFGLFHYAIKSMNYPVLLKYLSNIENPRYFCLSLINTFKGSLNTLLYFRVNELIHLKFTDNSLVIGEKEETLIGDIYATHFISELKDMNMNEKIFKESLCDTCFNPIEQMVLVFLFTNNLNSISSYNIDTIVSSYMNKNIVLDRMGSSFKNDYRLHCVTVLTQYVNMPKRMIIENIIKECNTWNVFSLSMIYLYIIMTIQNECDDICQTGFFNKWIKLLLLNTHPDPKKRKSIDENLSFFSKICYTNTFANFNNIIKLTPSKLLKINNVFTKVYS